MVANISIELEDSRPLISTLAKKTILNEFNPVNFLKTVLLFTVSAS
jgi:hypothetical protein